MRLEGINGESIGSTNNRLDVSSVMTRHVAQDAIDGNAYMWNASVDLGADKNLIWLRNDSASKILIIEWITLSVAAAAVVEIFVGSGTTPTPGTAVTGVNTNIGHANCAVATCYHTETSVDAGAGLTLFTSHRCGVTAKEVIDYDGVLRLGYLKEVAVNIVTDVAGSSCNILGFFSDH